MGGWGFMFFIIGAGSFILPMMNLQSSLIQVFGQGNEWITAINLCLVGGTMVALAKPPAQD